MNLCVVLVTAPQEKEAKKLTKLVLTNKLCACVNIIKGVESFFWWQGKIDRASEVILVLKTTRSLLPRLVKLIRKVHSYSVCEIIALPIVGGNKAYLKWVKEQVRRSS